MEETFQKMIASVFEKNALPAPSTEETETFFAFAEHLLKVNETLNLTAIRDVSGVVTKHFADSLLVSAEIAPNCAVLDVGCGAGFPSLPLAVARRDLRVTALDSTEKKVHFVSETAKMLGLNAFSTVYGRAEDRERMAEMGQFDCVVSRAVARLNVLCELCLPYVKIGGKMIAMKAAKTEEELAEAQKGIKILGGEVEEVKNLLLTDENGVAEPRTLILIRKTKSTPTIYPRPYAQIKKKPL